MDSDAEHTVKGRITRLFPSKGRLYFHTEGDEHPYGYSESDYNFIDLKEEDSKNVVDLLVKASENGWRLNVQRNPTNKDGNFFKVENVWIDFVFKEEALFNAV